MNQFKFLIAVVWFMVLNLTSKGQEDHLVPANGIFSEYDFQFEYYSDVRKILFNGLSDKPETRFVIIPSFNTEQVLDIEIKDDTYYLVYRKCRESIWNSKNKKNIKVDEIRKEISRESANLMTKLYKVAILKAKFEDSKVSHVDGENYYFSVRDLGIMAAMTWSPNEGTKMSQLVNISYALIKQLQTNDDKIEFSSAFTKKIEALIKELA
jgi:hypothetical protein